ncbi:carbohydrate ABC transporter permease [Vallitalea guaymasensis]|uniref:Carbohydrate ABC transporter permease n=1 Tax=Vallitalea guaymasensis TaxID=1185412 RepID=A0A8J8MAK0_9FIRM|nr:carbohydrate ABC transporter permease [Vallitalea guaymasensis]QUH29414.1 carbohydrate ABC transporter permease [Vallitalea guaymasensis]
MNSKPKARSYTILVILLVFLVGPILWMFVTSFKDNIAIYKIPPEWIPHKPTISNYLNIFKDKLFMTYYFNNFITAGLTTLFTIIISILAGYSFSRFKFKGSQILIMAFLSVSIFPVVGIITALYSTFKNVGLLNTRTAVILTLTAANVPFCMWLMKGFFDDIPRALEEAAYIDGCGRLSTLFKVILPLCSPGILAIGLYTFLIAWDDYLYCLTLITDDKIRTLSNGISMRYLGELSYDWGNVMTVSVMASIPLLILFIFLQKYMIQGLTAGSVKG